MKVKESGGGERVRPPDGLHKAICVCVVDLGTHTNQYIKDPKPQRKVLIQWELPEELYEFKEENGEEPFIVSKEYTASLADKANLRKDLESWRSKSFTKEELEGFDLKNLIGVACQVTLITKVAKSSGNERTEVSTIVPLGKKTKVPKQITESMYFAIGDGEDEEPGTEEEFDALLEWMQKKIQDFPEGSHYGQKQKVKEAVDKMTEEADEEAEDDLPF